jgi:hypothetical protein
MFICFDSAHITTDDGAPIVCDLPAGHVGHIHQNSARATRTGEIFEWLSVPEEEADPEFVELLWAQ